MSTVSSIMRYLTSTTPPVGQLWATVRGVIGRYDPATATDADLMSIRRELEEAGVKPGPALGRMLHEAGFDPEAIFDRVRRPEPPPPPPPPVEMFDALKQLLATRDGVTMTQEDAAELRKELAPYLRHGRLLDRVA